MGQGPRRRLRYPCSPDDRGHPNHNGSSDTSLGRDVAVGVATRREERETQEGAGLALAQQFRHQGLNMLPLHAQFVDDKGVSLEAGLMMMLDRMETGRLKIFSELRDLFEEISLYHRKDGRVVKEREDTICAVRYALMMLRFAETNERPERYRAFPRPKMGGNSWLAN